MTQQAAAADAIIMAAAVADYMPEHGAAAQKIAKQDGPLTMTLVRTPDILAELGRSARDGTVDRCSSALRAETGDPRPRARKKLASKQMDLIIANDVSRERRRVRHRYERRVSSSPPTARSSCRCS